MKSFDQLWTELAEKAVSRPEGSKTVAELDEGIHFICKKIIEEAGEVWLAAEHEKEPALVHLADHIDLVIQTLEPLHPPWGCLANQVQFNAELDIGVVGDPEQGVRGC